MSSFACEGEISSYFQGNLWSDPSEIFGLGLLPW